LAGDQPVRLDLWGASPGCTAVNAGFNASASPTNPSSGNITIANFAIGDTINFNVTMVGPNGLWSLGAGSNNSNLLSAGVTSTTRSYTVTGNLIGGQADTTLTQIALATGGSNVTVTATCTPAPVPTVTGLNPASGPPAGGTSVTITGTGFTGATAVKFGSAAASFTVNGATSITATSPAGSGIADITVTTAAGTSTPSAADHFTYAGGSSSVTLASSANPSQAGQAVTFTATGTGPGGTPTGTVTFRDGGVTLGTVALARPRSPPPRCRSAPTRSPPATAATPVSRPPPRRCCSRR
jgi:IPT/TIG domain